MSRRSREESLREYKGLMAETIRNLMKLVEVITPIQERYHIINETETNGRGTTAQNADKNRREETRRLCAEAIWEGFDDLMVENHKKENRPHTGAGECTEYVLFTSLNVKEVHKKIEQFWEENIEVTGNMDDVIQLPKLVERLNKYIRGDDQPISPKTLSYHTLKLVVNPNPLIVKKKKKLDNGKTAYVMLGVKPKKKRIVLRAD